MAHEAADDLTGKAFDKQLFRRLLSFARPYLGGFLLSTILLLSLAAATISVPYILGEAVDAYVVGKQAASLPMDDRLDGVVHTALLLAGIGALTFLLRLAQVLVINRTGQRVIHDMRMAVFSHVTHRKLRFFDTHPVGTLVTRVTSDIETLNEFFISGVDVLLSDLMRVSAITAVLFVIDWRMALATMGAVPLILLWSFVFQRRARLLFRQVRAQVSRVNAYMNEALTGVHVIHAFRREKAVVDRFHAMNGDLRDAHVATVWNFAWFFPGMELLTALGTVAVILVGYNLSIQTGDLIKFWLYLGLFVEPLRQLADKYNILQAAVAAGERIFRILDDRSALPVTDSPRVITEPRGDIRFEDVQFAYEPRKPVLRGISFHAAPGTRLALVGPTGSGKSTVINLLCRFYDPVAGRILMDGVDLRELDPHQLRRRIGVVLQDVFLFEGSVRENLGLGSPNLDDTALMAAARIVQAEPVIARLGGLDGHIRERGATLSTGEKQLLAFARTLAHDPVLLVLDEATAHIDTETEALLQEALDRLMEGRTAIVIAHRLSTIQECDRILVMHHGEIREEGSHEELLRQGGIYARLYRLQFT